MAGLRRAALATALSFTLPAAWAAAQQPSNTTPPDLSGLQAPYMGAAGHGVWKAKEFASNINFGEGVTVGDIEFAFNPFHLELRDRVSGNPRVREVTATGTPGEPDYRSVVCTRPITEHRGVKQGNQRYLAPCEAPGSYHGTAVLSLIGGRDDGVGITGIAPFADLKFAAHGPHGPTYRVQALKKLINALAPGDILLFEMQSWIKLSDQTYILGPADFEPEYRDLIAKATNMGLVVVMGAGNNGIDFSYDLEKARRKSPVVGRSLTNAEASELFAKINLHELMPDTGAITVGAANFGWNDWWDRSNRGRIVDVVSLGEGVGSAGFATNYKSAPADRPWEGWEAVWPISDQGWYHCVDFTGRRSMHDCYRLPKAQQVPLTVEDEYEPPDVPSWKIYGQQSMQPWFYTAGFGGTSSASAIRRIASAVWTSHSLPVVSQ